MPIFNAFTTERVTVNSSTKNLKSIMRFLLVGQTTWSQQVDKYYLII